MKADIFIGASQIRGVLILLAVYVSLMIVACTEPDNENGIDENTSPVLQNIDNQELQCGEQFNYQAIASDPDGDVLTYTDDTWLFDINGTTGLISFVASCEYPGDYVIEISVHDEFGGQDTESFLLSILEPAPENNPPII